MLYSYYYVAHCMIYLVLYDLSALCMLWHPLYNVIFWSWFVYNFSFPPRNHTHTSLPHTQAFITHPHLPHTHIHTVLLISSTETPINKLNCESSLDKCVLTDIPIGLKPATLNSSNSFSGTMISTGKPDTTFWRPSKQQRGLTELRWCPVTMALTPGACGVD